MFFLFLTLILIFCIRITHLSLSKVEILNQEKNPKNFTLLRRDIVDRNGILISRNIKSYHAAINPKLISNKNKFLIKLRLNFPELSITEIDKKLKNNKYFYLKKRINQVEKEKLWNLEKNNLEPFQTRIYSR